MTRKQALYRAIELLSENGENEAATLLHKLSDELPFYSWSEAAIIDAVEQFILDKGRNPTATDFKKKALPPHTVIKKRFGMTLGAWLEKYYPTVKPCTAAAREKITAAFIEDYTRIKPHSAVEFNSKRRPKSPCWHTVAVHNGEQNWRGLLSKLGLPVYNSIGSKKETQSFKVKIYTDYDFRA